MKIVGLDLAGVEKNKTGFCFLENSKVETCVLYKDKEIIEKIKEIKPEIIAIDAPLSLPKKGLMRKIEKELRKKGIRIFPPLLPSMKKLTERGIKIKNILRRNNFRVIETYPGAVKDILRIPRKNKEKLIKVLKKFKINIRKTITEHELDAVVCALIGRLFLENKAIAFGDKEGKIILPKKRQ